MSTNKIFIKEDKILLIVNGLAEDYESADGRKVYVDIPILRNAVDETNNYLNNNFNMYEPNIFKQAGTLCFFIRKYKPLNGRLYTGDVHIESDPYINEMFGWVIGTMVIGGEIEQLKKNNPDYHKELDEINDIYKERSGQIERTPFLNDIISNFREGSFSPSSVMIAYQCLFYDAYIKLETLIDNQGLKY
ncbi:MAG: hypothetical protein HPY53_01155 [Brevinematales bacterium]|nr:hypothetical protein [Brevinematales bacterium]